MTTPEKRQDLTPEKRQELLRTEPGWGLFTIYTVNLLNVPTHQHGKRGNHYVSYKDATELLFDCITVLGLQP